VQVLFVLGIDGRKGYHLADASLFNAWGLQCWTGTQLTVVVLLIG
jgi:hypothetical protein